MLRMTVSLLSVVALGAMPAVAQTQTQPHPPHQQRVPHHPWPQGQMDPALHAALHARLVGSWAGTIEPQNGAVQKLQLAVAPDNKGALTIKMSAERSLRAGTASDVVMDASGLRWTQSVAGAPCKTTAVLDPVDHHGPETMKGTMTCGEREIAFAVQKTKN